MRHAAHILAIALTLPTIATARPPREPCKPAPPRSALIFGMPLSESALPSRGAGPDYYHATLACKLDAHGDWIVCAAAPDDPAQPAVVDINFECAELGARGPEAARTSPDNCEARGCGATLCRIGPGDLEGIDCGDPVRTIDTIGELVAALSDGDLQAIAVADSGAAAGGTDCPGPPPCLFDKGELGKAVLVIAEDVE